MLLETKNQANLILYVTNIDDNPYHFNKLFKLRDEIEALPQDCLNIKVDFHYCEFLGHYGVAFLGGLFRLIELRGGCLTFDWNTLPDKIRMNLAQNGFLYDFGFNTKPYNF